MLFRTAPLALFLICLGCETEEPAHTPEPTPEPAHTPEPVPTPEPAPVPEAAPEAAAAPQVWLNLNTASEETFKTVPGVGDRMAHEFEEYRPYVSIQQFRKEMSKYVSPEQIAEYEKYVFVPIKPSDSDTETLQQIPGLTADEAATLIAARPFADQQAFLDALAPLVSAEELTKAQGMLATP